MPEASIPAPVSNEPVVSKRPEPESKKDFEIEPESKIKFDSEPESKKDFEPQAEIEFDVDGDQGRWRNDTQVRELVIYRYVWKVWPEDVEDKINHPTGLESYYELRYFSEGTNRKGERYADLYKNHRAKRDVWIDEYTASQAVSNAQLDVAAPESNVVSFRRAGAAH